ncbi:LamG domain-containing protein [Clostridium sporogenes]|uniref:LamG domain-containing protein n=1 Tax=Clostridium sporogenes TaxID=1509 RepID=A0AAE4JUD9_CLOSG|nr:LamG domain-containing protein [Clostridium sporogenes]MDS1005106.1 LamG domain-containing protein [Clostridium sporogenes]
MRCSLYIDNSSINLGNKFLDINNTLTFSFLIKINEYGVDSTLLAQNIDGAATYRTHVVIRQSGKLAVFIGNTSPEIVEGTNIVPLNKWVNISIVLAKTNLKIYVDGILDLERTVSNYYNDNTWLFAYQRGTKYFLKAYIDEFKIYNYAMTQEQIFKKLNKKENNYSQLLRYYKFDEVINSNGIKDSTGNYNIIINGFKSLSNDVPNLHSEKYLIKQENSYYSINNNYIDLGTIDNSEELNNIIDEYGYNDLSILTKELNNKRIPTRLQNDYYESFDINLNDIKDSITLVEENDKKYIEYDCDNYKISDKIKKINNAKFEVLMKE